MSRHCLQCGADISSRHYHAKYCFSCAVARQKNPAAVTAHKLVSEAIKRGELCSPRTLDCADCGGQAMDYDHRDYTKPLAVEPVCRSCNKLRGPAIGSLPRVVAAFLEA